MTLREKHEEVILNGGLNTKSAEDIQDSSTLRQVENLRLDSVGQWIKRPTYASTATPDIPTDANYPDNDAEAIFRRGTQVCVLTSDYGLATVNPTDSTELLYPHSITGLGSTQQKTQFSPRACKVSRRAIDRSQYSKYQGGIWQVASAIYSGVMVVAWVDVAQGGVYYLHYKAVDVATGAVLTPEIKTSLTNANIAINACPYHESGKEGVLITYTSGAAAPFTISTIRYASATNTFVADSALTTNARTYYHALAADVSGGKIYFAFSDDTAVVVKAQLRTIGSVTSTHTSTRNATCSFGFVVGASRVLLAFNISTAAYAEVYGEPATGITVHAAAGETFIGVTSSLESDSGVNYAIMYTACNATGNLDRRVLATQIDFSTITPVEGYTQVVPQCWIAGQAFAYEGRSYCPYGLGRPDYSVDTTSVIVARFHAHTNAIQRIDPVARILHDRHYSPLIGVGPYITPSTCVDGSDVHFVLPGDPSADAEDASAAYLPQTIFHSKVSFRSASALPLPYAEVDNTTVIASGITWEWDGMTPSEHAPLMRPLIYSSEVATPGTLGADITTCSYVAIYRWVDAQGRLHRSAPSNVATATTVAAATHRIDIYVGVCPFAGYDGNTVLQWLEPELYGTEDGGSTFHLIKAASGVTKTTYYSLDSRSVWWWYQDVQPGVDTDPQIYSLGADGSEITPEPPPAFRSIAVVGDRLWGIDAEDASRIWYTKPIVAGYAPEWASLCTLFVGDQCVAVADNNGVPTIFGASGIWQIYGEGPDATGNGQFSPARRLPHEVGCIDPIVCRTGLGTVFRGRLGYYLLDNGLSLQPVGLPISPSTRVESSIGYIPGRIVWSETSNEIRCIDLENEGYWVFNAVEGKWSKWTQSTSAQYAVDAVVADGRVWYLHDTASGVVVRREYGVDESPGSRTSTEGWTIQTPWLRVDGITGFGRIWELLLEMRPEADVTNVNALVVTYETQGQETGTDTWSWTGAQLATLGDYAQLRMRPRYQRCRAFRLTITETVTTAYDGTSPLALRMIAGVSKAGKQLRTNAMKGNT